jgi:hypothetical protein
MGTRVDPKTRVIYEKHIEDFFRWLEEGKIGFKGSII